MRISSELLDELIAHAREEAPNECCGMVGAIDGRARTVYRAENAEASPLRYSLHPREQLQIMNAMEEAGEELGAIYHSHTRSAPYPSQTDVNLAFYPDAAYLIVSVVKPEEPEVRAFTIRDGEIDEHELLVE